MASPCTSNYHGKRTTPRALAALWVLNQIMRFRKLEKSDLSLVQGSCSNSVGASAGTHSGGDAGDATRFNWLNRVKFGRLIGFNIHFRRAIKNLWSSHIHWTLLGSKTVSSAARNQNNSWEDRPFGIGLSGGGKALDFIPDSSHIHFVRKETRKHYVKKATAGYSQPGRSSKRHIVDRPVGWQMDPIGVVEVSGKEYILNAGPTFYPLADMSTTKPSGAPAPKPEPKTYDWMDPKSYGPGKDGAHVTKLGVRLTVWNFGNHYDVGPGPVWGPADQANVKDFQESLGWTGKDADGFPGPETLKRLAADPK